MRLFATKQNVSKINNYHTNSGLKYTLNKTKKITNYKLMVPKEIWTSLDCICLQALKLKLLRGILMIWKRNMVGTHRQMLHPLLNSTQHYYNTPLDILAQIITRHMYDNVSTHKNIIPGLMFTPVVNGNFI